MNVVKNLGYLSIPLTEIKEFLKCKSVNKTKELLEIEIIRINYEMTSLQEKNILESTFRQNKECAKNRIKSTFNYLISRSFNNSKHKKF